MFFWAATLPKSDMQAMQKHLQLEIILKHYNINMNEW